MGGQCSFKFTDEISRDKRSAYYDHRDKPLWPEDYTLTSESFWQELERGEWECPHDVEAEGRCLFHLHPDSYETHDIDEKDVTADFIDAITSDDRQSTFVGATFDSLELDHRVLDCAHNFPIELHYVTVLNTLDLSDAIVSLPIQAPGIRVEGELNLDDTIFERDVSFFCAEFPGVVSAIDGRFEEARFRGADFRADENARSSADGDALPSVQFQWIQFEEYTDFRDTSFDAVKFHDVDAGEFHLANATLDVGQFDELLVTEELNMRGVTCSSLDLSNSSIASANFDSAAFRASKLTPNSIEWLDFDPDQLAIYIPELNLAESTIDHLSFEAVSSTTTRDTVCFEGSTIASGTLDVGNPLIQFDFTRATVGELTLTNFEDRAFGEQIRFWETTFEGFDFSRYHDVLETTGWEIHSRPHAVDENENETNQGFNGLILTYLRAKTGANHVSDNVSASKFFIEEMRYKRRRHAQKLDNPSWKTKFSHAIQYLQNWFLNLTSRYGERASLVAVTGLVTLFGWQYLVDVAPAFGGTTRLLESFFVALVVFSLTRSIYR